MFCLERNYFSLLFDILNLLVELLAVTATFIPSFGAGSGSNHRFSVLILISFGYLVKYPLSKFSKQTNICWLVCLLAFGSMR